MSINYYSSVETGVEIPDDHQVYNEFLQDLICSKAERAHICGRQFFCWGSLQSASQLVSPTKPISLERPQSQGLSREIHRVLEATALLSIVLDMQISIIMTWWLCPEIVKCLLCTCTTITVQWILCHDCGTLVIQNSIWTSPIESQNLYCFTIWWSCNVYDDHAMSLHIKIQELRFTMLWSSRCSIAQDLVHCFLAYSSISSPSITAFLNVVVYTTCSLNLFKVL